MRAFVTGLAIGMFIGSIAWFMTGEDLVGSLWLIGATITLAITSKGEK